MHTVTCSVNSITALTPTVQRVILTPEYPVGFIAGQYLMVHLSDKDKRPFSIANPAYEQSYLELHIGVDPNNTYASQALEFIRTHDAITVTAGLGSAHIQYAQQPAIVVAGGTGFSYAHSIFKQWIHEHANTEIFLYWGVRHTTDFYFFDELTQLAAQSPNIHFCPVVEFPNEDWSGRSGWVHQAVLKDFPTLAPYQVYIAGRFEMAKVARDDFLQRDLAQSNLFGDAFAFI